MMPRLLRVLLVADYSDDSRLGSAKVVHKLREELRAAGHHCEALLAGDIGRRPRGRQTRQLAAPALAARAIARTLARTPFDVIDAASAEGLWIGAQRRLGRYRSVALVCRSNGIEHLNYRRMLDDSRAGLLRKPWTRRLWYPASRLSQVAAAARLADRLIVLNGSDRQFAVDQRWQPEDRVHVVPHGVSERVLSASTKPGARGGAGVLFCGSWDLVKGTSYLAQAYDLLVRDGAAPALTVLGPGCEASTVLASFSEAARPHVSVVDRVVEEQVVAEYRRHDLLVMPSTYEGFGLVALEAMSQGLPIVATPVGCVPDLVRDGVNGAIVPARDPAALASAVARLMSSPEERARLGAAAAGSVAEFTWARTAALTVDVYRRALEQVSS